MNYDWEYVYNFELDIKALIDAVKNIMPVTKDGADIQDEILDMLYKEIP